MIPIVLTGLAAAGVLGGVLVRRWPRLAALDVAVVLAATAGVALLVPIGPTLPLGESWIRDGEVQRALVIILGAALAALLLVTVLVDTESETAVVAGTVVAAVAVVSALPEPAVALPLAAALGLLAATSPRESWRGAYVQAAAVPALVLVAIVLIGATQLRSGTVPPSPTAVGPTLLAGLVGLGIVARTAVLPLHALPLRLARGSSLPLVVIQTAVLPGLFVLLVCGWMASGPLATFLAGPTVGPLLVTAGVLTLLVAAPAMLAQDDVGGVLAVHAIADLAVIVVGLGGGRLSIGEAATWLLLSMLARLAGAAALLAIASRTGTRSVRASTGWIRLAPLALVPLAGAIVAGLGWSGTMLWDARIDILVGATPGILAPVLVVASALTAAGYARLIAVGLRRPPDEARVRPAAADRMRRWSAVVLAAGLVAAPIAVSLGGTRLASALEAWRPFAP